MAFFYRDSQGIQTGSEERFEELMGARWTDQLILPPDTEETPSYSDIERQLLHLLFPLYRAFKKKPARLCVKLGPTKGSHSVEALDKIEKGSVISEYVGQWLPHSKEPSSYRWGPIDALKFRNYSAIIEDGFPNVAAFHLYNIDKAPVRIIFVALETIAPGQMLTVHYGMNHSVKLSYHTEYQSASLTTFFQKNSLKKILKRIQELRVKTPKELGWSRTLELDNLVTKLRYLYQTPGALMHLLVTGILDPSEVFGYYAQIDFRYFVLNFPHTPNRREQELNQALDTIQKVFTQRIEHMQINLLDQIRHRLYFSVYLTALLKGEDPTKAQEEALLWNEAFDALQKQDRPLLEHKWELSRKSPHLLQGCLHYAHEIGSPLLAWLQTLDNPPWHPSSRSIV